MFLIAYILYHIFFVISRGTKEKARNFFGINLVSLYKYCGKINLLEIIGNSPENCKKIAAAIWLIFTNH